MRPVSSFFVVLMKRRFPCTIRRARVARQSGLSSFCHARSPRWGETQRLIYNGAARRFVITRENVLRQQMPEGGCH
jgi:hypothetical protein